MRLSNANQNADHPSTETELGHVQTAAEVAPQSRMPKEGFTANALEAAEKGQAESKAGGSPIPRKSDIVLKKLRHKKGVTIDELITATGWQAHSIRGFLSGTVKKRLGLSLASEVGKDGLRRYRVTEPAR